ncbi:MAG TPA: hypothetical protein VIT91_20475 [Chthoniobacterales bacterium]
MTTLTQWNPFLNCPDHCLSPQWNRLWEFGARAGASLDVMPVQMLVPVETPSRHDAFRSKLQNPFTP